MILKKSRLAAAATFGAAMSALYSAPELQADVIDVSLNPSAVGPQSLSVLVNVQIDPSIGSFSQWNDSIGQTMFFNGGLSSWRSASFGSVLNTSTFFGTFTNIDPLSNGFSYVAFRSGGNVGWFGISFAEDEVVYTPGQFGSMGESVTVGVVPEPTSSAALATLALGAAGIRRKRQQA